MNHREESLHRIWSILVCDAGASKSNAQRDNFVRTHMDAKYPCIEFRFQGVFGFGGKFRRYDGKFYIDMYPEDRTPERIEIARKVNEKLAQIPFWMP